MNLWTETAKGKRAWKAIRGYSLDRHIDDTLRIARALRFLEARVESWEIERWPKGGGRYFIHSKEASPLGAHSLGGGNSLEWALIEAVCKVLDLENDQKRKARGDRRTMIEPRIRAKEIKHVVTLKCSSADLLLLAEMARGHKLSQAHVPFWTLDIGEVEVRFRLDHDGEVSARAESRKRKLETGD